MAAGSLTVVGLGPGDPHLTAPRARDAIEAATDLIGYGPYLDRVPPRSGHNHPGHTHSGHTHPGQIRHPTDNRQELHRARHALALAASGRDVAVISSGDAGVFAMASAVFEALEHGEAAWRAVEIAIVPGISALFAAAARLGAPLGGDFCAISLSDNLKPWDTVVARLRAAAGAGFVMALYNPISRARPWQLGAALDALRAILPPAVPVAFVTACTRPEETITLTTLAEADPARADMRTLVMIGAPTSRLVPRAGARPWFYTPRRLDSVS